MLKNRSWIPAALFERTLLSFQAAKGVYCTVFPYLQEETRRYSQNCRFAARSPGWRKEVARNRVSVRLIRWSARPGCNRNQPVSQRSIKRRSVLCIHHKATGGCLWSYGAPAELAAGAAIVRPEPLRVSLAHLCRRLQSPAICQHRCMHNLQVTGRLSVDVRRVLGWHQPARHRAA